jgi:hypothetical protein
MMLRMMDLRIPAIAAAALAICTAPASALTTYSWPVQLSQPVSITALPYTTTGDLIVVCSMHPTLTAGGTSTAEGTSHVPVPQTNGPVNYTGNLTVAVIAPAASVRAPQSGDDVSCVLRVKANGAFTNVGNVSDYHLP